MSKELDQHDAAAWSQRQRQRTPRNPAAPAAGTKSVIAEHHKKGAMLTECSEHLAREHHEQQVRFAIRTRGPESVKAIGWDTLLPADRELAVLTMRSLLYRGVIVCTKIEHRIKFSLRGRV